MPASGAAKCAGIGGNRPSACVMKIPMPALKPLAPALAALALTGCASLSHPPDDYDVVHNHDFVPHRDIGALPGSPENPDAGAGIIAGLLQLLVH